MVLQGYFYLHYTEIMNGVQIEQKTTKQVGKNPAMS